MVRVLMVNYEYPPLGGGTAVANYYLVKEFRKIKDIKVDVLTSSPDKHREMSLSPNIRIIRLDIGKNGRNLHHQSYLDLLRFFWSSTAWVLKHRGSYDLIHAFSGLPGSITAFFSGRPYLVSFRGADEPGYEPRHEPLWKSIKPIINSVYRRASFCDANSLYLKNLVLKSFSELKISVITNGADKNKFFPAEKQVKEPIILCTSRLAPRKGIEYLIMALALVPKAKLLLAGGGRLEGKMKRLVKKLRLARRVKFLGPVLHDRLPVIYRRAKLFVLPSLSESQSNSLLEALASGLPVIATRVGGNSEIVDEHNGILVPPADSHVLAEAIKQSLHQRWPKIKSARNFSWKETAEKYLHLYQKIVG